MVRLLSWGISLSLNTPGCLTVTDLGPSPNAACIDRSPLHPPTEKAWYSDSMPTQQRLPAPAVPVEPARMQVPDWDFDSWLELGAGRQRHWATMAESSRRPCSGSPVWVPASLQVAPRVHALGPALMGCAGLVYSSEVFPEAIHPCWLWPSWHLP